VSSLQVAKNSVLRWGGLAGVLGGVLFIVVFVIVAVFVGMETVEVTRFPEVRTARIAENVLYLAVLVLWVMHFLALYRALRETSPAPALFGSALGILGLTVLGADSLRHVWQTPIAELYHASGATAEAQATLLLLWQTTEGIFDTLLVTGLLIVPAGVILLGAAMLSAPAFGRVYGGVSLALGGVALAAAGALLVTVSPVAVLAVFALIAFHLVVGAKVYRLSQASATVAVARRGVAATPRGQREALK
jgi:hypothetical protein